MKDWTGLEIEKAKQGLEQAAAGVLGRMLFEYSRLEVALALALVWSGEGRELEKLTKDVESYSFHKKLELLRVLANAKYEIESEAHQLYNKWLTDADIARVRRNELVHGRWGVDPTQGQVVNVVGLPTSPDQREVRYSLAELKSVLSEMKALQQRLYVLRKAWPV